LLVKEFFGAESFAHNQSAMIELELTAGSADYRFKTQQFLATAVF
jgi:hypothetical protein